MNAKVSIILDSRRKKTNNLFPVKLRVYDPQTRKAILYDLGIDLSAEDFNLSYGVPKPKKEFVEINTKLIFIKSKASEIVQTIHPFTFEKFEKKMFRAKGDAKNIYSLFEERISDFDSSNKISSRDIYKSCLAKMKAFQKDQTGKESTNLPFLNVDVRWLNGFEKFLTNKNKSKTTVSIYTRAIQAVFNIAIEQGDVDRDIYPFGLKKYQRPEVKKVKKALKTDALKTLWDCTPENSKQEKARDFFIFSFVTCGMNFKDIAYLTWRKIQNGRISYYRSKTVNTRKAIEEISIPLNEISESIIEKYGSKIKKPDNFVFNILTEGQSERQQIRAYKNFTRFTNEHIKELAKKLGLPEGIGTNWARHSFSTKGIREGYSWAQVGSSLNHADIKTTEGYFAGFIDDDQDEVIKNITKI